MDPFWELEEDTLLISLDKRIVVNQDLESLDEHQLEVDADFKFCYLQVFLAKNVLCSEKFGSAIKKVFHILKVVKDAEIIRYSLAKVLAYGYKQRKNDYWVKLVQYIDEYLDELHLEVGPIKLCISAPSKTLQAVRLDNIEIVDVDVDYLLFLKEEVSMILLLEHFYEVVGYVVDINLPKSEKAWKLIVANFSF